MENQFLEKDSRRRSSKRPCRKNGNSLSNGRYSQPVQQLSNWSQTFTAQDRALVILIENGGVDLGIPDFVDKLWALIPGANLLPDAWRAKLVDYLGQKIRSFTDNLLESAELATNRYTSSKPEFFGDVTVLRNSTASYNELKAKLMGLSRDGKIADLLILTHGGDDYISVTGGIDGQKIRSMKTENGKPLPLRSVYMMNCVGSTLNQAWLDAGAKVSSGALRNNYLPEPTTFFFWNEWKAGQTFESAVSSAYRKTINLMKDTVSSFLSTIPGGDLLASSLDFENMEFVKDSAPVIQGQRNVTISSDDLSFSQTVGSSTLVTTVLSLNALRSLRVPRATSMESRSLSPEGVGFIKQWEGFRSKMYNDPVGHCTIGYGTLLHTGNCDGRASEQPYADGVSEDRATQLLAQGAASFQQSINDNVRVPLTQNQNDALVSFVYNIGAAGFRNSTLLRLLNQSNYSAVPTELKKWTKARQNGNLIDLPGLVKRRSAEADLFQKPDQVTTQSLTLFTGARAFGSIDYSIPGTLPVLAQPTPNTCWATVFTMMYSWKNNRSVSIADALATVGGKYVDMFNRDAGLDTATAQQLYREAGLEPIYSFDPSIDGWASLLRKYGPLYVDVGYNAQNAGTHAIIVTGISGDGSPDGTSITYVDPIGGTTSTIGFRSFLAKYEAQSAVQWPYTIVHWPSSAQASISNSLSSITGTARMFSPSYDGSAAIAYARSFSHKVCSDGFMMLDDKNTSVTFKGMPVAKVPAGARILRDAAVDGKDRDHVVNADGTPFLLSDGTPLTSNEMDDCTHFISCCIGQPPGGTGGGIKVPTNMWGNPKDNNPYGISRVQTLLDFLINNNLVRVVASLTRDKSEINKLDPGDIIAYFNPNKDRFTHLALYLGDLKIAAHTVSRLDEEWSLGDDQEFKWTLLHFV